MKIQLLNLLLVMLILQTHECPQTAIRNLLKEAFRVLRPRGTVALTDNSVSDPVTLL